LKTLTLAFVFVLATVLGGYSGGAATRTNVVQEVFGNQEVLDGFLASRDVGVQRLHLRHEQHLNSWILKNYDHEQEIPVKSEQFQQLQQLLQQPSSYGWDYTKPCIVDYGILFTFRSGIRTTRVALCFKCDWIGIFDGPDESARKINRNEEIDPIRPQLVAIAKALYPSDPEIQSLK
jgi:hypothetical protein